MSETEQLTAEDRFLLGSGVAGTAQGEKAIRIIDHLEACNEQLRIGDYEERRALKERVARLERRLAALLAEHGQAL